MAWNMTDPKQPPWNNGIVELEGEEKDWLIAELQDIVNVFEPNEEFPLCDTWYVTVTFNRRRLKDNKFLNGVTVEYYLSLANQQPEEPVQLPVTEGI